MMHIHWKPTGAGPWRGPRLPRLGTALVTLILVAMVPARAQEAPADDEMQALRQQLDAIRTEYERRIADLEARLEALESQGGGVPSPAEAPDDLAALRAAALREAGLPPGTVPEPAVPPDRGVAIGHERNLNRMNPEISFTGDLLLLNQGAIQDFDSREAELDLQSMLDPFSRAKLTLSFENDAVDVEEAYLSYNGLPGGVSIVAGKMRQTFGPLNRFHQHALPQVDYPLVYQEYFSEEGLAQTGVSVDWLIPRPWASANELTFQLTDASSEAFGGGSFEELAGLLHLKNFWDLSSSTYLEWGLSGIVGGTDTGANANVWGTDLTLHWQPPGRAKYREITWRTEALLSQREDLLEVEQDAWGGYTYVEGLVRRNLYVGVRYDWLEDPLAPSRHRWAIEPYVTWWQSEFVRLRGLYQHVRNFDSGADDRFTVQVTFAAGPHKHENY